LVKIFLIKINQLEEGSVYFTWSSSMLEREKGITAMAPSHFILQQDFTHYTGLSTAQIIWKREKGSCEKEQGRKRKKYIESKMIIKKRRKQRQEGVKRQAVGGGGVGFQNTI
jgi:hypothetical protein